MLVNEYIEQINEIKSNKEQEAERNESLLKFYILGRVGTVTSIFYKDHSLTDKERETIKENLKDLIEWLNEE